jgi:hypothetical protein
MADDPDKFVKLPRIESVDDRIRASEKFPRIRDAELMNLKMKKELKQKIADRDFQRELARKEREKYGNKTPPGTPKEKKLMIEEDYIEKDFFSYHVMNEDPEMSKYLDYDGLVFPKPYEVVKLPPEFIDKLWVSGFMDRANRDGVKKMKEEQKKMAKIRQRKFDKPIKEEDEEYIPLRLASDPVDDSEERAAADRAKKAQQKLADLMKGAEAAKEKKQQKGLLDDSDDEDDEQGSIGGDISVLSSNPSVATEKVELSEEQKAIRDKQEADEIERKKRREMEEKRKQDEKERIAAIPKVFRPYLNQIYEKSRNLEKEAAAASLTAAEAATKMEREQSISFLSQDLDFVFDRERQEHVAAARIQKSWKKIGRLRPWKDIVKFMLAARTIQRIAKGMITRKWVARWYNTRNLTIGCVQAVYRGYVVRKYLKPKLANELVCIIKIQKIIRGKFGRLKSLRVKYRIASSHIQALWRGVTARAKSDRVWLNKVVVPIQTMVRAKLARGGLDNTRAEWAAAALRIQKRFRCYVSRQKVGNMLRRRENEYRMDNISMLTSDGEHIQEKIEKMIRRLLRRDFQGKAADTLAKMLNGMRDIYDQENNMVEMTRQMEILSPRAITQGYYQELKRNKIELRTKLTEAKTNLIFKVVPKVLEVDHLVETNMLDIENVAAHRASITVFRDAEYTEKRERSYQRELLYRQRVKRQAIAEERRRWQVKFYTPDGKPDKKRRPGRPWDPSIFAGLDKDTYSASNVDIFADMPDSNKTKPGSEESIKQTMNTMSLQTYLTEVNAYEEMLQPITNIMQNNMGAPVGKPAPEDLGWGEEGKKMAPAVWKSGAVPASWHRPLSPGGTTAITSTELLAMQTKAAEEAEIAQALQWEKEEEEERLAAEEEERKEREEEERFAKLTGRDPAATKSRWGKLKSATVTTGALRSLSKNKVAPPRKLDPKAAAAKRKLAQLREAAEADRRREVARDRHNNREKRRLKKLQKKADLPPVTIPWALLDALDGAKKAFESEKAFMEHNHKI